MGLVLQVGDDVLCAFLGSGEFRVLEIHKAQRDGSDGGVSMIGPDGFKRWVPKAQCTMTPELRVRNVKRLYDARRQITRDPSHLRLYPPVPKSET